MADKKPLTKMEWMLRELNSDGFYPTEQAINRVLAGEELEFFEDALVDYIHELDAEWNSSKHDNTSS